MGLPLRVIGEQDKPRIRAEPTPGAHAQALRELHPGQERGPMRGGLVSLSAGHRGRSCWGLRTVLQERPARTGRVHLAGLQPAVLFLPYAALRTGRQTAIHSQYDSGNSVVFKNMPQTCSLEEKNRYF